MILDRLDPVSLVCLKNTNSQFRGLVPSVEQENLSRCQKWMIMCQFETDMQQYPKTVACAFCKMKRPQKDFGAVSNMNRARFFQSVKYSDIRCLQDLRRISGVDIVRIGIIERADKISNEDVADEYSKGCFVICSIVACIIVDSLICFSGLSLVPTEDIELRRLRSSSGGGETKGC